MMVCRGVAEASFVVTVASADADALQAALVRDNVVAIQRVHLQAVVGVRDGTAAAGRRHVRDGGERAGGAFGAFDVVARVAERAR